MTVWVRGVGEGAVWYLFGFYHVFFLFIMLHVCQKNSWKTLVNNEILHSDVITTMSATLKHLFIDFYKT